MIVPVVLAGKANTDLWPLSRQMFPLQLNNDLWETSFFQENLKIIDKLGAQNALVFACDEHRFLVAESIRQERLPAKIILQPSTCGSSVVALLAATIANQLSDNAVLLVIPSDLTIDNPDNFCAAIDAAYQELTDQELIEFVNPQSPSTNGMTNTGVIMARAGALIDGITGSDNALAAKFQSAIGDINDSADFLKPAALLEVKDLPFDISDLLRTAKINTQTRELATECITINSWPRLWAALDKDANGNASLGQCSHSKTSNCLVIGDNKPVFMVNVDDVVVVDTKDALLITSNKVKPESGISKDEIENCNAELLVNHRQVRRPWGKYDSIDNGLRHQVKRITVKPGEKLSVQMHHHRAEHWIVVAGTAKVTQGDREFLIAENESTYIPVGEVHALENPGKIPLELIEVQFGSYLGEDDIVRFQDRYGRN